MADALNFASDNASGAAPRIMDALNHANAGYAMPYGVDDYSKAAEAVLSAIFERDCTVFLVPTGTAANALALSAICPPWGAVFGHDQAHIMDSECGAPEFFTHGAKLVRVPGGKGRIEPAALKHVLRGFPRGVVKQVQASALTLSQASESGTLYKVAAIRELSRIAHEAGLKVHMDGARFANAVARLKISPADMTWKAGIDVLSFGGTKNGTLMCEAVVFFDPALAQDFLLRRKRGGHTVSKARFLGAQMLAYLQDGYWLELADHANRMAARLSKGLASIKGVKLAWPTQVNEVFAILPASVDAALKDAGAVYYPWPVAGLALAEQPEKGAVLVRLVTSFATGVGAVDRFLAIAGAKSTAG
ncbi:MAG: low specificity L-threonine aldolase [Beijerinckiaceae bacterium]|nr:low specificity L-threonine aldolase [Beijerinckiaceae bacterium]